MSAAAIAAAESESTESVWQRLRKRIGKAAKALDVAAPSVQGTATIGRHHKISSKQYHPHTSGRHFQYYTPQYGHKQYRFYRTGREVHSESEQTDGEYEDEDVTSCPNTPLNGPDSYIREAEFAFLTRGGTRIRREHCLCCGDQREITVSVGMKGLGPVPPPKPPRSRVPVQQQQQQLQVYHHSSQQQLQQPQPSDAQEPSKERQPNEIAESRAEAKDGNGASPNYHEKAAAGNGQLNADPDMVDGYHEFIKDSAGHMNTLTRKYIGFISPKTYPTSSSEATTAPKAYTHDFASNPKTSQAVPTGRGAAFQSKEIVDVRSNQPTAPCKPTADYNGINPDHSVQQVSKSALSGQIDTRGSQGNASGSQAALVNDSNQHHVGNSTSRDVSGTRGNAKTESDAKPRNVSPPHLTSLSKKNGGIYSKTAIADVSGKSSHERRPKPEGKIGAAENLSSGKRADLVAPRTASESEVNATHHNNNIPASAATALVTSTPSSGTAAARVEGTRTKPQSYNTDSRRDKDLQQLGGETRNKVPPKTKPKPSRAKLPSAVESTKHLDTEAKSDQSGVTQTAKPDPAPGPDNIVDLKLSGAHNTKECNREPKNKKTDICVRPAAGVEPEGAKDTASDKDANRDRATDPDNTEDKDTAGSVEPEGNGSGAGGAVMSLEINPKPPSSNSLNPCPPDEDPGYASVEEIPLDSPGLFSLSQNLLHAGSCGDPLHVWSDVFLVQYVKLLAALTLGGN